MITSALWMRYNPVYSKLALTPLAGNEVDSLEKHEHRIQSQPLLWSQIEIPTFLSIFSEWFLALLAFRVKWCQDLKSSHKQQLWLLHSRGQYEELNQHLKVCLHCFNHTGVYLFPSGNFWSHYCQKTPEQQSLLYRQKMNIVYYWILIFVFIDDKQVQQHFIDLLIWDYIALILL